MRIYQRFGKRFLDVCLSLLALLLLSPLLIWVGIMVRIKLGSPILFRQKRPGKKETIFVMYKFRTMTDTRDENGRLLSDKERLTKFGKWLRATSLDELPELFNILKGDMSFVGPRPQLVKDMVFMTAEQRKRHTVRQGLTGLAQVNGRNAVSWEEKLTYDLQYIKRITLLGDMKIIWETMHKVLNRDGIAAEGMETAEDLGEYLLRMNYIDGNQFLEGMKEEQKLQERAVKIQELYVIDKTKFVPYHNVNNHEKTVKIKRITPKTAGMKACLFWNTVTMGRCRIYSIRHGMEVVHTSYVIEKCYKFPFLGKRNRRNIEIGPCYTKENYRGLGIYPYVLSYILERELEGDKKAYMIVDQKNVPSQKGIAKVGFVKIGPVRKDVWKRYVITNKMELL